MPYRHPRSPHSIKHGWQPSLQPKHSSSAHRASYNRARSSSMRISSRNSPARWAAPSCRSWTWSSCLRVERVRQLYRSSRARVPVRLLLMRNACSCPACVASRYVCPGTPRDTCVRRTGPHSSSAVYFTPSFKEDALGPDGSDTSFNPDHPFTRSSVGITRRLAAMSAG